MDTYSNLKDSVLNINRDVSTLFSTAKSIPGMADYSFGEWEKACDQIPRQLAEDIIRVAVVGPIKSGKSTFLNSIFKGEFVKRGAGVITSIVTRVRSGECLRAKLFFKSWDEINAEMEQALVLFPSASWRSGNNRFDIRQPNERHKLKQALGKLSDDQLITRSTRNINNVLLTSYLKGYDTVTPLLRAENAVRLYKDDQFADHKAFVGNETLAVFLKDVLLEINSSSVKSNIEIADCQGSDSSNPLHLAMIQDYLRLTHLMVYVISSRTGLRQADIRFLSMIKKMGILDNIVFVVNCDFSEHESLAELNDLVERVREELSMIKPAPDVYSFSALFNLFNSNHNGLSDKDRLRLEQWKAEQDFIDLSNRETGRFETVFYGSLSRKRYALLLQNHIERLGVIIAGFRDWIGLNRDVLAQNADSVLEILKKIKKHQKRLHKIKSSIKKTLAGAMPEIKSALQQEVHRFFDSHSDSVSKNLHNFINGYTLASEKYQQNLNDSDFSQILYLVFQDFKQSIDSHITETINPELIWFVQACEKRVAEYFESVILPFDTMMEEAYDEFNGLFNRADLASEGFDRAPNRPPKIEATIKSSGLRPPTLVTATYYSAKIKAEAILRLGYYKALRKSKTVLKKAGNQQDQTKIKALQDALQRMKRETAKSIAFHLKDYRENLIFGYLYKLVEVVSESFSQEVLARFQAYFSDLSVTVERIGNSQSDKEQAIKILEEMDRASKELIAALNRIRVEIDKSS
ncbi:MAG: dynamin family protein [Deltaproteobacteria bacterium]|nr:dynamin family protein [Deltaproteobacteria bacterium]